MYKIIKHYRCDPVLRGSFNALAEKTFGLNFENWYQNGFWGDNYDPYSVVIDGAVAANVSLNRTDMVINGQRRRLYQLGTVMTDERYRRRGLIRAIMAEIEQDVQDADGVYLFGSDSVVDFYPKFGFRKGTEYLYTKNVSQNTPCTMTRVTMDGPENWRRLETAMAESAVHSRCQMVDNPGLIFFYVSQFMQTCVYYCEALDAWAIAELEDDRLMLHQFFGPAGLTVREVIRAFGQEVRQVSLGFAPMDDTGFEKQPYHKEDCTFFVKGDIFGSFEASKLRIPSLSHA